MDTVLWASQWLFAARVPRCVVILAALGLTAGCSHHKITFLFSQFPTVPASAVAPRIGIEPIVLTGKPPQARVGVRNKGADWHVNHADGYGPELAAEIGTNIARLLSVSGFGPSVYYLDGSQGADVAVDIVVRVDVRRFQGLVEKVTRVNPGVAGMFGIVGLLIAASQAKSAKEPIPALGDALLDCVISDDTRTRVLWRGELLGQVRRAAERSHPDAAFAVADEALQAATEKLADQLKATLAPRDTGHNEGQGDIRRQDQPATSPIPTTEIPDENAEDWSRY